MKILFVGDGWAGSNARSLLEALQRRSDIVVHHVDTAPSAPVARSVITRAANRLLAPVDDLLLWRKVTRTAAAFGPDIGVFYKGTQFPARFIHALRRKMRVVNYFPDCSPHAHGHRLMEAMGSYDLVISAKHYHPQKWHDVYQYSNRCVCVGHGYDPEVHFRPLPATSYQYDVVLVGTAREEYFTLFQELADRLRNTGIRGLVAGNGWSNFSLNLPAGWDVAGPQYGPDYVDLLRNAAIVIAPVQRNLVINGVIHPGDEDSARTYEIAAANCFFIHQRTPIISEIYDQSEVPLFDDPDHLAQLVKFYLARPDLREAMARRAHERAVPEYSTDSRARQIVDHLRELVRGDTSRPS